MKRASMVGLVVIGIACGGATDKRAAQLTNAWSPPAMLAAVPADSPYLFATLDPISPVMRELMFGRADRKFHMMRDIAASIPPDFSRSELPPFDRAVLAFVDELRGMNLATWGQQLGFDPGGRFVLYGLSVWPVLRVVVADAPRLRGVATRVLGAAGPRVSQHSLQGQLYWRLDIGTVTVIGAVLEHEAVLAVLPPAAVDHALPLLFAQRQPSRSMRDTSILPDLFRQYGLIPTMSGYVDAREIANLLVRPAATSASELDGALRPAVGPVTEACRADVDRVAALVPRVVLGHREIDARQIRGALIVEMLPAVARALKRLQTAVPGVTPGIDKQSLFSVGAAVDVRELITLLRELTTHVRDRPFQCAWFAPVGDAMGEIATALDGLQQPAQALGVRGLSIVVDDMTLDPPGATGRAVIMADRAGDALGLLLRLVPPLSGITVPPDGRPVELPIAALGLAPSLTAHAAARVDRAVVAVGPTSLGAVSEGMNARTPQRSPLLSFTFDAMRLMKLDWVDEETVDDLEDFHHVALQLEVTDEGLALEVYGTLPER